MSLELDGDEVVLSMVELVDGDVVLFTLGLADGDVLSVADGCTGAALESWVVREPTLPESLELAPMVSVAGSAEVDDVLLGVGGV